jgi:FkbM family methyltransferase
VLALEPNRYVFPVLEATAGLNPESTRIVPLMIAASTEARSCTFEYSDPGFCNGGRHLGISRWRHGHAFPLQVEGKNLQALLEQEYRELIARIRFIKIDAEGYDHTILTTLTRLVSEYRPYVRAEVFSTRIARSVRKCIGFSATSGTEYTGSRANPAIGASCSRKTT